MENIMIVPRIIADGIKQFLNDKWAFYDLEKDYPNVILRSDVLSILDRYCTVVYYPLENEKNNGFHVERVSTQTGEKMHFVFVNTAQSIDKQVFTAAHELGHIWKVDEHICKQFNLEGSGEEKERIINRFAAELLMKEEVFKEQFIKALNLFNQRGKAIEWMPFLKIIAFLMNVFMAPMKAVVLRLAEIGALEIETIEKVLKIFDWEEETLDRSIARIIAEDGYVELQKGTQKKWIEGLAEMLDTAENQDAVSETRIKHMREAFDLTKDDYQEPVTEMPPVVFAEESEWRHE